MKKIKIFVLFTTLLLLTFESEFETFKLQMENKVASLAAEMDTIFTNRCNSNIINCEVLSYIQCQGTSQKKCFDQFPKPQDCVSSGAYLSKQSAMRFPYDVDEKNLSDEQKQFVCTSALMEDKFKSLNDGRQARYGKAYIGSSLGSFRSYPTSRLLDEQNDQCVDYDPRFRPWYVTAASGAKNVIIMIDTSGSMSGDRLQIAKDAATAVINTLSNSDFVGVISFSNEARNIYSNKIIRATSTDKQNILKEVNSLEAIGETNYQLSFRKAFQMIDAAESDQFGAPCIQGENIFLFLTDGVPTRGYNTSRQLKHFINSFVIQITLFTYALGNNINPAILKDLACTYKGIMFTIPDSSSASSLATTMKNYYTYISEGVQIYKPVWTQPYIDAFGFGRMVTVSMPIYYVQNNIRRILGVAGIDILWEQIQFGLGEQEVIKRLINNAPCHESDLTECQIQQLRGEETCEVSGCSSPGSITECTKSPKVVFRQSEQQSNYICCGLTVGGLIGVLISVSVAIFLIILTLCCLLRKKRAEREENHQNHPSDGRLKEQAMNHNASGPDNPYIQQPYYTGHNQPYVKPDQRNPYEKQH